MNYSEQTTYGRKVVKGGYKKKSEYYKRLYISWGVCILIGLVIGILVFWGISSLVSKVSEPESYEPNVTYTESPSYGTVDDRIFNSEISMDWDSGASLGFVPLDVPLDEEMQEFIYCLSYGYNIEFPFVMALIEQESSFRTNIQSSTNDYGLMQINEINHEWLTETLGVTDFNDPYQNVRSGIFILRKLFEKYEDPSKVLMCYNLGETGARRLWNQGIYETNYSKSILERTAEFEAEISERKGEQ